jgi:hypothetical protein
MNKKYNHIILWLLLCSVGATYCYAQENLKLGQTGFQFLSVVSDARAAAMAEAVTSLQFGCASLFFNPSGMANMTEFIELSASHNQWFADITHYTFNLAISPASGKYGVIGFSLQSVDYGKFIGTKYDPNSSENYSETGTFTLNALAIGVGYAKQLSDKFSVGGHVRWVKQDLGSSVVPLVVVGDSVKETNTMANKKTPLAFDFGTQFKTGFKSLVFGMSIRNFSQEIKYAYEGFQLPLVFNLGVSMNLMDFINPSSEQILLVCIDADHNRDYPERLKFGVEYQLMKVISLRGGYMTSSVESGFSFGIGMSYKGLVLDYSYTPIPVFNGIQRITTRFSL